MKVSLIFMIFLSFAEVKTVSRVKKNQILQTAFVNISKFLAKINHEVPVVMHKSTNLEVFSSSSGIPHKVFRTLEDFKSVEL